MTTRIVEPGSRRSHSSRPRESRTCATVGFRRTLTLREIVSSGRATTCSSRHRRPPLVSARHGSCTMLARCASPKRGARSRTGLIQAQPDTDTGPDTGQLRATRRVRRGHRWAPVPWRPTHRLWSRLSQSQRRGAMTPRRRSSTPRRTERAAAARATHRGRTIRQWRGPVLVPRGLLRLDRGVGWSARSSHDCSDHRPSCVSETRGRGDRRHGVAGMRSVAGAVTPAQRPVRAP